jgi:hypothetical protein
VYNDNDFLNLVDSYDILFLGETWLNDSNLIDIDGFVKISCAQTNTSPLSLYSRTILSIVS